MENFELIIFDLDGTIINTKPDIVAAINKMLNKLGLKPMIEKDIFSLLGHGPGVLAKDCCGKENSHLHDEAVSLFRSYYYENIDDKTYVYDGMFNVIEKYKDIKKIILTNKSQKFTDKLVKSMGLEKHFLKIFGPEAFNHPKPHPEPILETIKMFNVKKSKTILIGDSEMDIQSAHNAGISVCGVTWGFRDKEFVRKQKPTYLVNHPNELLNLSKHKL